MISKGFLSLAMLAIVTLAALMGFASPDQVDRKLRQMLEQLGYTVKDLDTAAGKEKYSFTIERGGLNVPVAAEISPNNKYIWLTVFCKAGDPAGDKAVSLLHKNADIQPSQFYLTKTSKLMMGLCIENHDLTNVLLRDRAEKIVDDVVNTKDTWQ